MKSLILALVALGPAAAASAQFFGGGLDGETGFSSEKNTVISDGFMNFHCGGAAGALADVYPHWVGGQVGTVFSVCRQDHSAGGEWETLASTGAGDDGVVMNETKEWNWPRRSYCGNEVVPTPGDWGGLKPFGPLNDDKPFFNWYHFDVRSGEESDVVGEAGFSHGITKPACYADCDQSGELDVGDCICFQTLFATSDPLADCDESGELDVGDFICYQTAFALGCP